MYEEILREVDEKITIEILRELIKIKTVNPPGNEEEAAEYIRETLEREGIKVNYQHVEKNRPNVMGILEGLMRRQTLLLEGHMDVVPVSEEDEWIVDPFSAREVSGFIYGRGAVDAKGSLAAMISSLIALKRAQIDLKGNIVLLATVGEETGNMGVRYAVKKGLKANMAVVGEPTDLKVMIAHKGVCRVECTTIGKAAHAASPWDGVNAITKMAKLILELDKFDKDVLRRRKHELVGCPSLTITLIKGGIKRNVVPDKCTIHVDRRLIPGEKMPNVKREIEEIVRELERRDPQFRVKVDYVYEAPPSETRPDEEVVSVARRAVKAITGEDPGVAGFKAHCDMGILVNEAKIPTVILGPGDLSLAHKVNERVEKKQVVEAAKAYALICYFLMHVNQP